MKNTSQNTFALTVKNQVSELSQIVHVIEILTEKWKLSAKFSMHLNLILEEVFSNIVFYAFPKNDEQSIIIDFTKNENNVTICITDSGKQFNLLEYHNVDIKLPADERQIGGLGIHILKELTDKLEYERKGNQNVVKLVKNI